MLNRRRFLQAGSLVAVTGGSVPVLSASVAKVASPLQHVLRQPDLVRAQVKDEPAFVSLQKVGNRWTTAGLELGATDRADVLDITLHAPKMPVQRIHLRWRGAISEDVRVLGDAWERSYGDLAWLPLQPERVLPWYLLASRDGVTAGAGVKTGCAALAFWQVDSEGISLWLDVRNGGNGVVLDDRVVALASVVALPPTQDRSWNAAKSLCRKMAGGTTVPGQRGHYALDVLYGSNDWYYAYGKNTSQGILRDADLMREMAPAQGATPFCIIDDGYQDAARFPSLQRLAEEIRQRGVAPGIWIRPMQAKNGTREEWLLPAKHWRQATRDLAYDPTIPEAREQVLGVVRQARDWGYDFLKHDFTTYELLGGWGKDFGASPTREGWSFHDRSRTNAEIIRELYMDIRRTAGENRIILGCNTVGHLSVGIFDASRTGDDTSGRNWERTRRMGVNTLAFRLPQDRVFYRTDADCVPFTPDIPWQQTEAWLRAVAASGSILLVSPDPRSIDARAKAAIREAFALAAQKPQAEPTDWIASRTPFHWKNNGAVTVYPWLEGAGASPFPA
jgi:alpha-galactosidase